MYNIIEKFKFFSFALFNRILLFINRVTISKVIIIFTLGFISRVLINNIYNVNVFVEYTHTISLVYYTIMSLVIVLVSDLVAYFQFSLIPSFVFDLFGYFGSLVVKFVTYLFGSCKEFFNIINKINRINLDALKLSSIRRAFSSFVNGSNSNKKIIMFSNTDFNVSDKSDKSASLLDVSSVLFNDDDKGISRGGGKNTRSGFKNPYPDNKRVLSSSEERKSDARMGRRLARGTGMDVKSATDFVKSRPELDGSLRTRFKFRMFWYTWKQFDSKYSSYDSFLKNRDSQLSIIQEFRNDIKNKTLFKRNKD